ncbi:MAG: hypothetical protein ACAH65_06890, partial [Chloroflexota bacterium]
ARTNRKWTVPVAAAMALPVLWFAGLSILAAIPAMGRPELDASPAVRPESSGAQPGVQPLEAPAEPAR